MQIITKNILNELSEVDICHHGFRREEKNIELGKRSLIHGCNSR